MNKEQVELSILAKDVEFWESLFLSIAKQNKKNTGVFGLWAFLYICIFTEESSRLFDKHEFDDDVKNYIAKCRHRMKFINHIQKNNKEKKRAFKKIILDIFDENNKYFIQAHKGFLAPLKKFLATDLGLYVGSGKLIGTTFLFSFESGVKISNPKIINESIYDFSVLLGEYLGHLMGSDLLKGFYNPQRVKDSLKIVLPEFKDSLFQDIDKKAKKWYLKIDFLKNNENKEDLIFLTSWLTFLFSKINFFSVVVPKMENENNIEALFKLKYITLFNFFENLNKLMSNDFTEKINKQVLEKLKHIARRKFGLEKLLKNKKFRNVIVHYEIKDDFLNSDIKPNVKMYGLIEKYHKITFEEMNQKLDEKIEYISNLFDFKVFGALDIPQK